MISCARRAFLTSLLQPCSGVGGRGLCITSSISRQYSHGKTIRNWKKLDPNHADEVYEHELVGKSSTPDTLVYTWGVADHGGLGRASFVRPDPKKKQKLIHYKHHPHRLEFAEHNKVIDVACGYGFTVFAVAKTPDASCFGTGLNTDSQIGNHQPRTDHPLGMLLQPGPIEVPLSNETKIKKVAAGRAHTVMLTEKDGVWTVGNNAYGQCGRPIIADEDYSRSAVYHKLKALDGMEIQQVACGQDTSYFVSEEGIVYSCGWGADGQTGRGHYDNEPTVGPVVGDIVGEKITKVSCRADCALALSDKGEVFGWGNNEYHQLSSVSEEMQSHTARKLNLHDVGRVVDIASSGTTCLVVNENGDVYSWGYGLLGKGPAVSHSKTPSLIPSTLFGRTQLTPEAKVLNVYCGISFFAAVNSCNSLYTWGINHGGCLGLGHRKDQYFPFRVALAGQILKVSCGVDHMAAMVREII